MHEPRRRISVLIEAPSEQLLQALARIQAVKKLFDGRWIHLVAIEQGRAFPYCRGDFRDALDAAAKLAG